MGSRRLKELESGIIKIYIITILRRGLIWRGGFRMGIRGLREMRCKSLPLEPNTCNCWENMYIALLGKMKFKNMQILGELTTKRSTP